MKRAFFLACMLACNAHVASENATEVALPVILPTPTATIATVHVQNQIPVDDTSFTSERGAVRLVADGDSISGAYTGGVLTCKKRYDVLSCEWFDSSSNGHAKFRHESDGRFVGTYGNNASDDDAGPWTLAPIPAPNLAVLDGAWDTNWGLANVRETASGLHVDYPNGQMDCTRASTKLACTWSEGGTNGTAELTIESTRVMRGSWAIASGASAPWVFVRH